MKFFLSNGLVISFPYDREFRSYIQNQLGGKHRVDNIWTVPEENEELVRIGALAMLGTDGKIFDMVTAMIVFERNSCITMKGEISVGPISLFHGCLQDERSGPATFENVEIVSGKISYDFATFRLSYAAPVNEHGLVVVSNVARYRALLLAQKVQSGEIRDSTVREIRILSHGWVRE